MKRKLKVEAEVVMGNSSRIDRNHNVALRCNSIAAEERMESPGQSYYCDS